MSSLVRDALRMRREGGRRQLKQRLHRPSAHAPRSVFDELNQPWHVVGEDLWQRLKHSDGARYIQLITSAGGQIARLLFLLDARLHNLKHTARPFKKIRLLRSRCPCG